MEHKVQHVNSEMFLEKKHKVLTLTVCLQPPSVIYHLQCSVLALHFLSGDKCG